MKKRYVLAAVLMLMLAACDVTTPAPTPTPAVGQVTLLSPATLVPAESLSNHNRPQISLPAEQTTVDSGNHGRLDMSDPATYAGATIEFSPTPFDADMPAFKAWKTVESLENANLASGEIAASEVVRLTQFPGEQIVITACAPLPCDVGRFYVFAVAGGTAPTDSLSEARIFSYDMTQYRAMSEGWATGDLQRLDGRFTIKFTDGSELNYIIYAGGIVRHYSPDREKQDQEILYLLNSWLPELQQMWAAR